jgi:predicted GNAT family acetyltransferase
VDAERVEVADNPAADRYEILVDGEPAGMLLYRLRPGLLALNHTEVDDRFEGEGLASRLVSFALEDARRRELAVLPFCPFVNDYIQRHREYVDLVPAEHRDRFGL